MRRISSASVPEATIALVRTDDRVEAREEICWFGKSIYDRGLTAGSSGNISARVDRGWLTTTGQLVSGAARPGDSRKVDGAGARSLETSPQGSLPLTHHAARSVRVQSCHRSSSLDPLGGRPRCWPISITRTRSRPSRVLRDEDRQAGACCPTTHPAMNWPTRCAKLAAATMRCCCGSLGRSSPERT